MDTSDIMEPQAPRLTDTQFEDNWKRLETDFDYFTRVMFEIPMQPMQGIFGQSCMDHFHTVGNFCRQTGKSVALAAIDCKWLWLGDHGKPALIGAYAPTFEQSHEIMYQQVITFMESQPLLADDIIYKNSSRGIIRMSNGNELKVSTAAPDSHIRGRRITIAQLDESQDIIDRKYNADIIAAGAASTRIIGGKVVEDLELKIVEAGTPGGRNHYYEANLRAKVLNSYADLQAILGSEDIALVMQPWQKSTVIKKKTVDRARRRMSKNLFEQEYECKFNLDTGFAFEFEDIEACTKGNSNREFTRIHDGQYVAGIDLGRNRDHSVLVVLQWRNPYFRMVEMNMWDLNLRWQYILDDMIEKLKVWSPDVTFIDIGNVGDMAFDRDFVDLPFTTCEGFTYATKSKVELFHNIQRFMQRQRLILWDDDNMIEQLRKMPEDRTKGSLPRFDKPDDCGDDIVQALAMAVMAGTQCYSLYELPDGVDASTIKGISYSEPEVTRAVEEKMLHPIAAVEAHTASIVSKARNKSIWEQEDPFSMDHYDQW